MKKYCVQNVALNTVYNGIGYFDSKDEIVKYLEEYEAHGWNGWYRIDNKNGCCFLGTLEELKNEF